MEATVKARDVDIAPPPDLLGDLDVNALLRNVALRDPRRALTELFRKPDDATGFEDQPTGSGKRSPVEQQKEVIQAIVRRAANEFDRVTRTGSFSAAQLSDPNISRRVAAEAVSAAARDAEPFDRSGTATGVLRLALAALRDMPEQSGPTMALDSPGPAPWEDNVGSNHVIIQAPPGTARPPSRPNVPPAGSGSFATPVQTSMEVDRALRSHTRLRDLLGAADGGENGKKLHRLLDKMLERRAVGGEPTPAQVDVFRDTLSQTQGSRLDAVQVTRIITGLLDTSGTGTGSAVVRGGRGAIPVEELKARRNGTNKSSPALDTQPPRAPVVHVEPTAMERPPIQRTPTRVPVQQVSPPESTVMAEPMDEGLDDEDLTFDSANSAVATRAEVRALKPRPKSRETVRSEAVASLDLLLPRDVNPRLRERLLGMMDRFLQARSVGAQVADPEDALDDWVLTLRMAQAAHPVDQEAQLALEKVLGVDRLRK